MKSYQLYFTTKQLFNLPRSKPTSLNTRSLQSTTFQSNQRDSFQLYFKRGRGRVDEDIGKTEETAAEEVTEVVSDLKFLFNLLTNGLHKTFITTRKRIQKLRRMTTAQFIMTGKSDEVGTNAYLASSFVLQERETRVMHIIHDLTKTMVNAGSTRPFENMEDAKDVDDVWSDSLLMRSLLASKDDTVKTMDASVSSGEKVSTVKASPPLPASNSSTRVIATTLSDVDSITQARNLVQRRLQEIKALVTTDVNKDDVSQVSRLNIKPPTVITPAYRDSTPLSSVTVNTPSKSISKGESTTTM